MTDFQTVLVTTLAIVCSFTVAGIVIGLIFHYSFIKDRKRMIREAKEKYPELFQSRLAIASKISKADSQTNSAKPDDDGKLKK